MQTRFGLSWVLILGAVAAFVYAVWSAAVVNLAGFWLGFAGGIVLAFAGLSARARADRIGLHMEHPIERGLIADESDLELFETPQPREHERDLEDRRRP